MEKDKKNPEPQLDAELLDFLQANADGTYTMVKPRIEGVERVDFARVEPEEEILYYSIR